ncbi:MAG: UDP-N-acetylmuramate--alanine ligase [Gaiellales bacterium]|jgi:UDP-N-acetylmuramate--alanine ligase|nr:UDP-N-acetylmuramate--alanine ligase [Gaiellales bacterium]
MSFSDRRLHMIGIGGAGVSALATVAYAWGADVSGCDRAPSVYSERLARFGVRVEIGHDPAHLEPGVEVVVSSAIAADEPELLAARELGLPRLHRAQLLAEMVASRRSICVAGAHGKTTTSAMIAYIAQRLGLDPTFLIGGDVPQLGGNAGPGGGPLLVAEADESDGSLSLLRPRVAVVTNIELDHHARFGSLHELHDLFAAWTTELPAGGTLVAHETVALPTPATVVRYGYGDVEWQVSAVEQGGGRTGCWLRTPEGMPVHISLELPGAHNALNAAAAIAALHAAAGVQAADAAAALAGFTGVGRRFELRGLRDGAWIVDDYAHHPTEVAATIAAARGWTPGRVVVCFQPHLYSRTEALAHAFGKSLASADEVVVTEIYAAREQPVEGVTAKLVVDAVSEVRPGMPLAYQPGIEASARYLAGRIRSGDMVLTVGAGDVRRVGDLLLEPA